MWSAYTGQIFYKVVVCSMSYGYIISHNCLWMKIPTNDKKGDNQKYMSFVQGYVRRRLTVHRVKKHK